MIIEADFKLISETNVVLKIEAIISYFFIIKTVLKRWINLSLKTQGQKQKYAAGEGLFYTQVTSEYFYSPN